MCVFESKFLWSLFLVAKYISIDLGCSAALTDGMPSSEQINN